MKKFIDVDKILEDKSPRLAKWLPKFLVRYLKRILHQNEINQILEDNRDKNDYEFCVEILKNFNIKVESQGLENIPKSGGAIFVCNHPLGGMDALAIIQEVNKVRSDIKFVVNDILLNLKNLSGLFVGVNKHGTNTKQSIIELNNLFGSDQAVFVFPAGLVSRKKNNNIEDLEWKKTFVTRAKKFKRNVIPVYIDGELSKFFYRLSNIRKKIGVKANIEMLYLVNETFKQKNKKYIIKYGAPISFKEFNDSKTDKVWAEYTKNLIYNLKD
jgi:1-acyl-sn-glycerol-3-phosphate acyltransferase